MATLDMGVPQMERAPFDSSFGYFQNNGTEFVVTEVNPPRALVNYFWNERFISGVSHHGGGEGLYKERTMQYIDHADRAFLIRDGHRYFYLRNMQDGSVWCPGWHPVQTDLVSFRCRHGLGYSIVESTYQDIHAVLRVFVPAEDPCEIWTLCLRNEGEDAADLKLFTFADWALEGYPRYCDYFGMVKAEYYEDLHAAQGCNRAVERRHPVYDGFVASDRTPTGFDTSRRAFVGNFGHVSMPAVVKQGACTGSLGTCEKLCSVLEHTIALGGGEEVSFNIIIGASSGYDMTKDMVSRLTQAGAVEEAFSALRARKQAMVERLHVDTPDTKINFLVNGWMKQQIQIYADVGSDNGRGFRDAMQLLWATASYDPSYTKRMLHECLQHQLADGHCLRGWLPVDTHHYSDGPVWITPAVDAYLRETGEYELLDEIVPYFDDGEGTIWDHVLRGLRHASDDVGARGMVLCHFGDWNDSLTGVGIGGKGESVWTTIAIVFGLKLGAEIAKRVRQNADEEAELLERAERLTAAIQENGWDGEWYLRAINDAGEPVGSHTEEEGKIFLLPQVWAVMASIVDQERQEQILAMVDKHLESDYGSLTLFPPYTKPNDSIGRLTWMNPGMWENGTPYCHANGFKIIGDCYAGRGDKAYTSFKKAMPDSEWNPSTHSGCEPYVLTNQYLGPTNPRAGETLWAWMTGAGGWYFRALTNYMIGVRADFDGLLVDPCLPASWPEVKLEREFRGARYVITIRNPEGLQTGTVALTVDGEAQEGNLVPIFADGQTHHVEAVLAGTREGVPA